METSTRDLTALTARRLVTLIAVREVSAREVVTAFVDRITALDGALGAFVHVDPERMLADAAAVDTRRPTGPLDGLPVGIKDIFDVAGAPTSGGSALPPALPTGDSKVVARLRQAGAILAGKLTTSEYGCGSAYVLKQPRNPWDRQHAAGGSSTGSAIAVASRMLPATIGGDTGGSIRIPASFCGVVGLRPSTGSVPVSGSIPLAPGIDTAGPMTATLGDAELLLRVMSPDLERSSGTALTAIVCIQPGPEDAVDPQVAATVDRVGRDAAHVLGLEHRSLLPGPWARAWAGAWVTIYSRALVAHRALLRQHLREMSRPFRWKLCAAAALAPDDVTAGDRIVGEVRDELSRLANRRTLLIAPTTSHPAHPLDRPYAGVDTMAWTAAASLAGMPALSVPAGRTTSGLPIAVQLIAPPRSDLELLRLAERLERAGVVGGIGSPTLSSADVSPPLFPLLSPPTASVSSTDIEAVRAAARQLGFRPLDPADAEGAARSLEAVREALYA